MDVVSQRMFGAAAIIFATLFGISTFFTNTVQADNTHTMNATGKIMMEQNSFVHGGNFYWHLVFWDTETGKSKVYNFNPSSNTFKTSSYQLPSSPLY